MELKTAVVTGASSGIGYAISKMLSEEGYKVYGIGRIFKGDVSFFEERISMDIRDTDILLRKLSAIKQTDVLVNAAGSQVPGVSRENVERVLQTLGYDTRIRGEVLDIGGFAKIADEITGIRDADL